MSRRYRVREEVNAGGVSTFYIEHKEGLLSFWETVRRHDYDYGIEHTTLKEAQQEVDKQKSADKRRARYVRESKIVKTRYHGDK